MAHSAQKGKLLAVIGDEDTVVGFMLGGIGECLLFSLLCLLFIDFFTPRMLFYSGQLNKARKPNYFIVEKNTTVSE